jgi:HAD superfamily hydrolase (TIGR01484 family)
MRFLTLACDYDGTLALDGRVNESALDALRLVRESGRRLVLVTGRQIGDLLAAFPEAAVFDRIVGENGATLYRPATGEVALLAAATDRSFVAALRARGVGPLSVGRAVVATQESYRDTVLETIRELGLDLVLALNKGAVMVLPSGVDKATGLRAALRELGLRSRDAAAIGDAENDRPFLECCGCAVAVGNALPALKERADYVTRSADGAGVAELAALLVDDDLAAVCAR